MAYGFTTKNIPQIKVSDFEFHLPRPSYTYNTLNKLAIAFPDREYILVVGADNWADFSKWYKAEYILKHYQFIIYPRKGHQIKTEQLPANAYYMEMPLYDICSTEIRQRLSQNGDISAWVNADVEKMLKSFQAKQQHRQKCPPCDR